MSSFIIQFRLKTEKYQEDILDKRFEIGRKMYNTLLNKTQKRYKEMIKTKQYRDLISLLSGNKKKDKEIWKAIEKMRKEYNLSEYAFHKDIAKIQKYFRKNIDSFTAQKIATHQWKAYKSLFYKDGESIHFKKYGTFNSLEGKTNSTGIRFKNDTIIWNGLNISVLVDHKNVYEYESLQSKISYCRIIRRFVNNKNHYYVQLILQGIPPLKIDNVTGENKNFIGSGDVGLDIGTSTIAIASTFDVKLLELADKVKNINDKMKYFQRKQDRSRRSMNPENFNENGTIKKENKKLKWKISNHYRKNQNKIKKLSQKQKDTRKYQHECLANYIISLGNKIYVEDMNFKGLMKRAKKTEVKSDGKFKRKKRFGKSIGHRAPSMLINIIDRKLEKFGTKIYKINTYKAKASQYNHFNKSCIKKTLSNQWNNFNGERIQRDLYSAFLIMNINSNLEDFNTVKCDERYVNFKMLHDLEIERIRGQQNLSSMAV